MSQAPRKKKMQAEQNRQAIRRVLRDADYDLDRQTIADRCPCSRTTVSRQIKNMDDVVVTRKVGRRKLYELQE